MASISTSLSIVRELRRLASIESNRDYMLRNDVNSLLIFADPSEQPSSVVIEALHAVKFLTLEGTKHTGNLNKLKSTIGLITMLKEIQDKQGYNMECKNVASEILSLLNIKEIEINRNDIGNIGLLSRTAGGKVGSKNKESLKFLGETKKTKVITLQIEGLIGQDKKQECIDEVIQIKGVISLTFNMNMQRCIVRAKPELSAENLAGAIQKTKTMKAKQVVKDENGEEVFLEFDEIEDNNSAYPAYLDEDIETNSYANKQSLARPDGEGMGLARSWFGSVLTAVNKNLYW